MIEFPVTVDFADDELGITQTERQYASFSPYHIIMCVARPDGRTVLRLTDGEDFPVDVDYRKVIVMINAALERG